MAYTKQTWKQYDDNKTEEQNIQDGAVVTSDRMNHIEEGLETHSTDKTNPHGVTKTQVGLDKVDNIQQAPKSEFDTHVANKNNPHSVTKSQVGLGNVDNVQQAPLTDFNTHKNDKTNPHSVTKAQTGLGSVDNYSTATQSEAELGTSSIRFMTPLRVFQAIAKWTSGKFMELTGNQTVAGTKNFQDGIIVEGNLPILGKSEVLITKYSSSTDPNLIASGSIELQRDGNLVTCTFTFKPKNNQAANSKLIQSLGTDFEPVSQVRISTVEGSTYFYNDPSDGNALKFGMALSNTQWTTGSTSWIAKNKY